MRWLTFFLTSKSLKIRIQSYALIDTFKWQYLLFFFDLVTDSSIKSKSNAIEMERAHTYASTPPKSKLLSQPRRPPVPMRTDSTRSVGCLPDPKSKTDLENSALLNRIYFPLQSVKEDEFPSVNIDEKHAKVNDWLITLVYSFNSFDNMSQPFGHYDQRHSREYFFCLAHTSSILLLVRSFCLHIRSLFFIIPTSATVEN